MKKFVPDFENNLLRVIRKEKTERATLFELYLDKNKLEERENYE